MVKNRTYGLVVCGGKSSRMGMDKASIDYHGKPQGAYLYEMLGGLCEAVFMSCNADQQRGMSDQFNILVDLPDYRNIGPMTALLTAFHHFPDRDFLIVGCDYPFIHTRDLDDFLVLIDRKKIASTFYNRKYDVYEPLLGWYSQTSKNHLLRMFKKKQYGLQHFLKDNYAGMYLPPNPEIMTSVDTPEDLKIAKDLIYSKNRI